MRLRGRKSFCIEIRGLVARAFRDSDLLKSKVCKGFGDPGGALGVNGDFEEVGVVCEPGACA